MAANESQEKLFFPNWSSVERVDALSAADFDGLPVGAIQLDVDGNILRYNQAEERISGRAREDVLGRNFFTEVAPCTNVQEFAGRFREGVAKKELEYVFPFVFDFKMTPTKVWVRLLYSKATDSAWVFVRVRTEA